MKLSKTVFVLSCALLLMGQTGIKTLEPTLGIIPDFSPSAQTGFAKAAAIMKKLDSGTHYAELTVKEKELVDKYEGYGDIWDILPDGCSWYCGGGPYKVTASSFLKSSGDIDYKPENAHDLSFKTAWVPKGYGIGEYLEYYFKNDSPRITDIKIYNGYVKNDKAWKENSRVKKIKLYVNNAPYAILNLKDTTAEQSFSVGPLGQQTDGKDLILKFEIVDIYKGTKFADVVLTEIFFDGLDVHCVARGTTIRLPHGNEKPIEDLKVGDAILTYDMEQKQLRTSRIGGIITVNHCNLVRLSFEGGVEIVSTDDHPFWVINKGWSSLNPKKTKHYSNVGKIEHIEAGDEFLCMSKDGKLIEVKLTRIEKLNDTMETHTITALDNNNNFFANGLLVAIEVIGNEYKARR
jgi:hypothetical protein